jgi:hypothetical protein
MSNGAAPAPKFNSMMLLEPNATDLTLAFVDENTKHDKLNPLSVSEPAVSAIVAPLIPNVNELPKLHPPPIPLNVILPLISTPLVVIVLPVVVELNVIKLAMLQVVVAFRDIEPETVRVGAVPAANVTVPADTVISKHVNAPVIVTVYVPAWSKKTESADVGAEAPAEPPDDADQCVVVVSHVPVPPTQYLFAINYFQIFIR